MPKWLYTGLGLPLKTHLVFVTYISTIKNSKCTLHAGFGLPLKPKNIGRYFILHFSPSFHLPIANFFKKTSSKRRTCRPIQVIPQSNVAEKYCRRNMHALFWCYCLIEDWTWGRDVFWIEIYLKVFITDFFYHIQLWNHRVCPQKLVFLMHINI